MKLSLVVLLAAGILFFSITNTVYAEAGGGTVKNPSGQSHGACSRENELKFGISNIRPLSSEANCLLYGFVYNKQLNIIEVYYRGNADATYQLPVEICFQGNSLGVIMVNNQNFYATYMKGNQSCITYYIGTGSTTFEYIP